MFLLSFEIEVLLWCGGLATAREAPGKRLTTGLMLLLAALTVASTVAPTVRLVADAALPTPCFILPINDG